MRNFVQVRHLQMRTYSCGLLRVDCLVWRFAAAKFYTQLISVSKKHRIRKPVILLARYFLYCLNELHDVQAYGKYPHSELVTERSHRKA